MADATASISSGYIQASQDWYAWYFDRASGYLQADEGWYEWNFARAPIETSVTTSIATLGIEASSVVTLPSLVVSSELGVITPKTTKESKVVASGRIYKMPKENASVRLPSLRISSSIAELLAHGTIKINNVVKLSSISIETGMNAVNAEGILDVSDEEIILLMAA